MNRFFLATFSLSLLSAGSYQKPPQAILDVLNAPGSPTISVSPKRTHLLLETVTNNPTIADIAKPMLRLAGFRIDAATNGRHLTSYITGLAFKPLDGGPEMRVALPPNAKITTPRWSADGKMIALANAAADTTELWVVDVATAKARKLPIAVNAATESAGAGQATAPFDWLPDQHTLLVKTVPAGRGNPPAEPIEPPGPSIQESSGKAAPVRTNQDMLRNPYDEELFQYYATSQLALVDVQSGKIANIGKPAILLNVDPSPDGRYTLLTRITKPFSYLYPATSFPRTVEILDHGGKLIYTVANLPLADRVPIEGVSTGPRGTRWLPSEEAAVVWTEALDGGNPKEKVPHRDKLMVYRIGQSKEPAELNKTEHRLQSVAFTDKGAVWVTDYDRTKKWVRTVALKGQSDARQLFSRNSQDRYKNAGTPVVTTTGNGQRMIQTNGQYVFLHGEGASAKGDIPFLDRMDTETLKTERLFQSSEDKFEDFVALLSDDGSRILISRESPTEPRNYFIREASGKLTPVTNFKDPAPQLRKIKQQLVTYTRPDGVPLSFTLYLPPDYQPGTRLPTVMWAYPLEFNDADTAGQVSGSTKKFTAITGMSHLFFLLEGYAILDNASMPVVGDPETVNNTYLEQITASAKAAIDKAAEMGFVDPNRVGVGGHSYGAFMTANLLAHSNLFKAGIARSGAYNRTLTPFGFQSERRTYWEAPEIYGTMSPFMSADKLKTPILFIHGEADNNQGTFPIQSERMYQAVRGNAGTARLVMLPHESHGYSAKESIEHVLYEMVTWFDKYVKNPQ